MQVIKKYNSNYNSSPIIGSSVNTSNLDITKTTDYVGNKIFEDDALDRILVDGGYIQDNTYYFYETDHLGSNRTVINQSGIVTERSDYYPYGMQMAHNDPAKGMPLMVLDGYGYTQTSLKFNNKELDVMHGLNLYDSQARSYDPTLGLFTTVDPLAEKNPWLSPYIYCSDNPLNRVDPDGKNDYYKTKNGEIQGVAVQPSYVEDRVIVFEPLPEVVVTGKAPESVAQKIGDGVSQVADGTKDVVKTVTEAADKVRLPDFYSLNVSAGSVVGWNGNVTIDRHGEVFVSLLGVSVGKSSSVVSASLTANWMLQSNIPSANETYNFLSGHGASIGGGNIVGADWTISPTNSGTKNALGIGLYTPQFGVSYNYTPNISIFNKR